MISQYYVCIIVNDTFLPYKHFLSDGYTIKLEHFKIIFYDIK